MRILTIHPAVTVRDSDGHEGLVTFDFVAPGVYEGEVPDPIGVYLLSIAVAGDYRRTVDDDAESLGNVEASPEVLGSAPQTATQGDEEVIVKPPRLSRKELRAQKSAFKMKGAPGE